VKIQLLARPNLSTAIVAQLRDMVLNGELRPGEQLPGHRELARMFGVSVTSVREAISALTSAGVLEAQQGRGTFVATTLRPDVGSSTWLGQPMNETEQTELVEAREVLECALARLAAQRATGEQVQSLQATVAEMALSTHDAERYLEADLAFHMTLAAAAHNRVLLRAMHAIRAMLRRELKAGLDRELAEEGELRRGLAWHAGLADAIAAHDAPRAEAMTLTIMEDQLQSRDHA
jgi:GntR family transcriptional repressor for pyruvate dehydrogenase complex